MQKIFTLKYGNTNTYLVGSLLIDTDMPGTLPALWRELKKQGIAPDRIQYVFATHYHPRPYRACRRAGEKRREAVIA